MQCSTQFPDGSQCRHSVSHPQHTCCDICFSIKMTLNYKRPCLVQEQCTHVTAVQPCIDEQCNQIAVQPCHDEQCTHYIVQPQFVTHGVIDNPQPQHCQCLYNLQSAAEQQQQTGECFYMLQPPLPPPVQQSQPDLFHHAQSENHGTYQQHAQSENFDSYQQPTHNGDPSIYQLPEFQAEPVVPNQKYHAPEQQFTIPRDDFPETIQKFIPLPDFDFENDGSLKMDHEHPDDVDLCSAHVDCRHANSAKAFCIGVRGSNAKHIAKLFYGAHLEVKKVCEGPGKICQQFGTKCCDCQGLIIKCWHWDAAVRARVVQTIVNLTRSDRFNKPHIHSRGTRTTPGLANHRF